MEGHRAINLIDSESALKTQQNYFQTTNPNPQKPTKPTKIMCKKTKLDATKTSFLYDLTRKLTFKWVNVLDFG